MNWQLLLLDLGIKKHKIDIIELNSPGNISKQKLNALELWLKETPDASSSWMVVIDALYEMDENVLATDLKRKYAFEDPRVSINRMELYYNNIMLNHCIYAYSVVHMQRP